MTSSTVVFLEQIISGDFFCIHCCLVSLQVFIKTRIWSQQCLFKFLNGICNVSLINAIRIHFTECLAEGCIRIELFTDFIERLTSHFHRIQRRSGCLICQCSGTSIPELYEIIQCIIYSRSVHTSQLSAYTFRE